MATRRVLVIGVHAESVGRKALELRGRGHRVVGFVGDDQEAAREMAEEMLGGVDEVVELRSGF